MCGVVAVHTSDNSSTEYLYCNLWNFHVKNGLCVKCLCSKIFIVSDNLTRLQLRTACVENISCV